MTTQPTINQRLEMAGTMRGMAKALTDIAIAMESPYAHHLNWDAIADELALLHGNVEDVDKKASQWKMGITITDNVLRG